MNSYKVPYSDKGAVDTARCASCSGRLARARGSPDSWVTGRRVCALWQPGRLARARWFSFGTIVCGGYNGRETIEVTKHETTLLVSVETIARATNLSRARASRD